MKQHREEALSYQELTLRNRGYIDDELQSKIRRTRVLVAGCGVGSVFAEAAARMGFEHIALADADTIDSHNLNRQAYDSGDIGHKKVAALGARLRRINPGANIVEYDGWVNQGSADSLVAEADFVMDTIDFLDLPGIVALHDSCHARGVPLVSAVSAGFGAAAIYFPPRGECTLRQLFGLPPTGPVDGSLHMSRFEGLIGRLAPEVVSAMSDTVEKMRAGLPCPAPHLAVGASVVASLCITVAVRVIAGQEVTAAPRMITADMTRAVVSEGMDLTEG